MITKSQILIINLHSKVDLITNSSSELFICNDNKTIDTIKALLTKLAINHNDISENDIVIDGLFNSVLREPTIAKYSFDFYKFPFDLLDEYKRYHNIYTQFMWCGGGSYENSPEHQNLRKLEEKARQDSKCDEYNLYKSNKAEYNKRYEIFNKKRDEIWAEWNKKSLLSEIALFKWFLINNQFTNEDCVEVDKAVENMFNNSQTRHFYWLTGNNLRSKINDVYQEFQLYCSYGIEVEKGNIMIESAGDNTIPGEFMEAITTYLHASRYHLG